MAHGSSSYSKRYKVSLLLFSSAKISPRHRGAVVDQVFRLRMAKSHRGLQSTLCNRLGRQRRKRSTPPPCKTRGVASC
jgi:hypothetical protein